MAIIGLLLIVAPERKRRVQSESPEIFYGFTKFNCYLSNDLPLSGKCSSNFYIFLDRENNYILHDYELSSVNYAKEALLFRSCCILGLRLRDLYISKYAYLYIDIHIFLVF